MDRRESRGTDFDASMSVKRITSLFMTEPRPTRVDGRETMDRLLSFAERELTEVGAVKFQYHEYWMLPESQKALRITTLEAVMASSLLSR